MLSGNQRPELNISDCAELIPGARPHSPRRNGRPPLTEWVDFESRAKRIHASDKTDAKQDTFSRAMAAQKDLDLLTEMFPGIDNSLIQIMYTDTGMNLNKSIELLITIAVGVDTVRGSAVAVPHPETPVVIANGKDWPMLTTSDGWQMATEVAVEVKCVGDETGCTWKDALMKKRGQFESSRLYAEPTVKQLKRYNLDTKKCNAHGREINDEDPNIMDYEVYKKLTHKRLHGLATSVSSKPHLSSN